VNKLCSVQSDSELSCVTPEVPVGDNVIEDFNTKTEYPIKLYVHLGTGEDVLMGGNTSYRFPFQILPNPTIYEWESVQGFELYEDQTHIVIHVRIRKSCYKPL